MESDQTQLATESESDIKTIGQEQMSESKLSQPEAEASLDFLWVTNLPADSSEETLSLFFQKKSVIDCDANLMAVDFDKENKTAQLKYDKPQAVTNLLEQKSISFHDHDVKLKTHLTEIPYTPLLNTAICLISNSDAETVLNRDHVLDGAKLLVSKPDVIPE